MDYYVCDGETCRVLAGPWGDVWHAADVVHAQPEPLRFGTVSRYALTKEGVYPRGKKGDAMIEADLRTAKLEGRAPVTEPGAIALLRFRKGEEHGRATDLDGQATYGYGSALRYGRPKPDGSWDYPLDPGVIEGEKGIRS